MVMLLDDMSAKQRSPKAKVPTPLSPEALDV